MTNLIILGNGFDMAHNLKTSYSNFFEYLIISKLKNENLFSDLFEFDITAKYTYYNYDDLIRFIRSNRDKQIFDSRTNMLFKRLANKLFDINWCDIEREYFTELLNVGEDGCYETASKLNADFAAIKKHLSYYLELEQNNFEQIEVYQWYFEKMCLETTMFLNFNYTNTVSNYLKDYRAELVQIHGEIENQDNPIIFGYAADDNEARELLQIEDKEFMRNIKKHNYKRTKEENRLIRFLDEHKDIEVTIIGHSCGLSDKLILNQIFNNENVSEIRMFYHKDYEHYFETQVNIDRIMNNDSNFRKLINFQDSLIVPQKNNTSGLDVFGEKLNAMLEKRKKLIKSKQPQIF